MLGFFKALLDLLAQVGKYFADRQLLDAGKAQQQVENTKEEVRREQKAQDAVSIPDAARSERLRNKYDRSKNGK